MSAALWACGYLFLIGWLMAGMTYVAGWRTAWARDAALEIGWGFTILALVGLVVLASLRLAGLA